MFFLVLGPLEANAQSSPKRPSCPVIAKLPADLKTFDRLEDRRWFELRQCIGSTVVVNGYEPHQTRPSLTFDTGDQYPIQLFHILNVLAFESVSGSANHVYVFAFHQGKPSLALNRSTAGGIVVKQTESAVTVKVPVKTYPDADGKSAAVPDASYSFPLEH